MKAIVAGATGLVGKELVKLLLEDDEFREVVVYVRRPYDLAHDKLRVVQGELSGMSARRDELKGDVYFCCLGTTIKTAGSQENFRKVDFFGVMTFARIAFNFKARKFITISASGAHSQSKIFYNRVKGETEKALKDIGFTSLVIFRPGLLVGERAEKRTAEKVAITAFSFLRHVLPDKVERKMATPVTILARHMIQEARSETSGLRIIESQDI